MTASTFLVGGLLGVYVTAGAALAGYNYLADPLSPPLNESRLDRLLVSAFLGLAWPGVALAVLAEVVSS